MKTGTVEISSTVVKDSYKINIPKTLPHFNNFRLRLTLIDTALSAWFHIIARCCVALPRELARIILQHWIMLSRRWTRYGPIRGSRYLFCCGGQIFDAVSGAETMVHDVARLKALDLVSNTICLQVALPFHLGVFPSLFHHSNELWICPQESADNYVSVRWSCPPILLLDVWHTGPLTKPFYPSETITSEFFIIQHQTVFHHTAAPDGGPSRPWKDATTFCHILNFNHAVLSLWVLLTDVPSHLGIAKLTIICNGTPTRTFLPEDMERKNNYYRVQLLDGVDPVKQVEDSDPHKCTINSSAVDRLELDVTLNHTATDDFGFLCGIENFQPVLVRGGMAGLAFSM